MDWWCGLKMRRRGLARPIALMDKKNINFTYSIVDPLPENLHLIDLSAGGTVQIPELILNPDTKDRYIVRSLIEESITSSQLEGAATTRDVAKEMLRQGRPPRDRSEQMILNNYQTMQKITSVKNDRLTKDLVSEIHRMITMDTLNDPTGAGRFRRPDEPVVVTNQDEEVLHEPPPAGELERRMELMCEFANGKTATGFIHPAVRSMILHFWLAYDHPFLDGNGRTARALYYWSMLNQGYWLCEFISISEIILRAPAKYGRAFLYTETDENDLTYFLLYHTEIVRRAIEVLHDYVVRRTQQLQALEAELRGMSALNDRQRDLVGHALRHPGHRYTIESHRSSHNIVYETARTDLMDLARRGLLTPQKRGRAWYFTPAIDLEEKLKRLD
jgi:Fic family protein